MGHYHSDIVRAVRVVPCSEDQPGFSSMAITVTDFLIQSATPNIPTGKCD